MPRCAIVSVLEGSRQQGQQSLAGALLQSPGHTARPGKDSSPPGSAWSAGVNRGSAMAADALVGFATPGRAVCMGTAGLGTLNTASSPALPG